MIQDQSKFSEAFMLLFPFNFIFLDWIVLNEMVGYWITHRYEFAGFPLLNKA